MQVDTLPNMISTERLTLRQWTVADVDALSAAVTESIEHLRPWMPWIGPEPISRPQRVALIEHWHAEWSRGGDLVIGVFRDGAVVGSSGLHRRRGPGVLEIGYWVHVDHVQQGIATEVARALTTAAFTVPDIERVEIHHDKANAASAGVPRRLGYTFVDETPVDVTSSGEMGIDCRWVVRREEWAALLTG